jgi:CheY-like chemotaxis protein
MLSLLLIDDERMEHRLFDNALRTAFGGLYKLEYARSVASALPLLESKTFDLIFLDDQLSNLNNAVVSVPQLQVYSNGAPIVVVSKSTNSEYMKDKDALGVAGIVNKFDLTNYLSGI